MDYIQYISQCREFSKKISLWLREKGLFLCIMLYFRKKYSA